ncbi:LysR family transcriptional regulator [Pseudomonas aeruginosa]|uniref:LysR family transcriptional regulator n=1 Tax=Pseudomonas aeruginosa TaxID=287 RepID=UPI0009F99EDD|nr:LysR family transcriptional regulator [Pseudomonas aeruginosa]ORE36615.1 hypothetical protein BKN47_14025 [Pseudomonas aeruginosa]RUI63831.1 LysR family transcriptional regulator [Pseudomonas aeruginosa]RUJ16557.1 LysR family transcriptional regulator [Pseudomonas aeruginosa]RUK25809.1 LysR family transcriptional regulator [Pseudomonas aeruginosa]HCG0896084.1 LysR family transcriptional regulator [Pseudomonas aeruginosa]
MHNSVSDMSCFIIVAESITFTEAAKKLGVAKSSISYRMAVLEKRLGIKLLDRGRKTTLTREGAVYYERAVKVLEEIKSIEESIKNSYSNLRGVIKVSIPVTFSEYISPILSSFAVQHPHVFLDVDSTDKHVSFREEDYDVAVRVGVNTDHSLIVRKVARNSIYMCASPAYIKLHGTPVTPYDLKDHDGVLYKNRLMQGGWRIGFNGRDELFKVRSRLISDNALVMLSATLDGIGISLLPQFLVRNFIKDGRLVRVLSDCIIDAGDVSVAYRAVHRDNARVKALVNFLVKEIERIIVSGGRVEYNEVVN